MQQVDVGPLTFQLTELLQPAGQEVGTDLHVLNCNMVRVLHAL